MSSGATAVNVTLGETGSVEIYRLQPAASDPQSTHELKLNGELLQLANVVMMTSSKTE